jgi:hypothetical protein
VAGIKGCTFKGYAQQGTLVYEDVMDRNIIHLAFGLRAYRFHQVKKLWEVNTSSKSLMNCGIRVHGQGLSLLRGKGPDSKRAITECFNLQETHIPKTPSMVTLDKNGADHMGTAFLKGRHQLLCHGFV